MILAPLRGVTVRCFREVFAEVLREVGFAEAVTPFIPANAGVDPLKSSELRFERGSEAIATTPQFIGKDPDALRSCLLRIREAGYETADLNCGCPYPMVRRKGRGSGILRTPEVLQRMLEVGCEVMGPGKFSVKARLGVDGNEELLALMPIINSFPLRVLVVHPRNARQMYEGECDWAAFDRIAAAAKVPLVRNGDLPLAGAASGGQRVMVGRAFVRHLGGREDIDGLLGRYIDASRRELSGEHAVLGRMKELLAYWRDIPRWKRAWPVAKMARTLDELRMACIR